MWVLCRRRQKTTWIVLLAGSGSSLRLCVRSVSRFLVPIRNLMQLVTEGSDTDTEHLRGMRPVAVRFFQCIENVLLLYGLEGNDFARKTRSGGACPNFAPHLLPSFRQ